MFVGSLDVLVEIRRPPGDTRGRAPKKGVSRKGTAMGFFGPQAAGKGKAKRRAVRLDNAFMPLMLWPMRRNL